MEPLVNLPCSTQQPTKNLYRVLVGGGIWRKLHCHNSVPNLQNACPFSGKDTVLCLLLAFG